MPRRASLARRHGARHKVAQSSSSSSEPGTPLLLFPKVGYLPTVFKGDLEAVRQINCKQGYLAIVKTNRTIVILSKAENKGRQSQTRNQSKELVGRAEGHLAQPATATLQNMAGLISDRLFIGLLASFLVELLVAFCPGSPTISRGSSLNTNMGKGEPFGITAPTSVSQTSIAEYTLCLNS